MSTALPKLFCPAARRLAFWLQGMLYWGQKGVSAVEENLNQLYKQLHSAVGRLHEALNDYHERKSSVIRDGVIQRFEFCTELAWEWMRLYVCHQGFVGIYAPEVVLQQARDCGVLTDVEGWLKLIEDRNMTSHVYNEETAEAIFKRIETVYLKLFDEALAYMK